MPEEIDDPMFWQEFRHVVKQANPDAYIVGEIWHIARAWLQGDRFDAVMNYPLGIAAINFFGASHLKKYAKNPDYTLKPLNASAFAEKVNHILSAYHWDVNLVQLNMIDSHDTPRALWLVNNDLDSLRLSALFLMCMPGAPCIYYGTEIGMTGGDDPYCRAAFPWDKPESWDNYLREFYQGAIRLRRQNVALRTGKLKFLKAADKMIAFARVQESAPTIIAFFNAGTCSEKISVEVGDIAREESAFHTIWGSAANFAVENGQLRNVVVPGRSAVILRGA